MKKALVSILLVLSLLLGCIAVAEESAEITIELQGGEVVCDSTLVTLKNRVLTIEKEGSYVISGKADDLQIVVRCEDGNSISLILSGAELYCDFGPAICVDGDGVQIVAVEGSVNVIADARGRREDESSPSDAVIYSTDSLSFSGKGELQVTSLVDHAIHCKDNITIEEITLVLDAANDGLHGNDSVIISSGNVSISALGDGIQTTNADDGKGNVMITGGTISIVAGDEAIQSVRSVVIEGGKLTMRCGEGAFSE